jgi:hypothetical protein
MPKNILPSINGRLLKMRLTGKKRVILFTVIPAAIIGVTMAILAAFYSILLAAGVVNVAPEVLKSLVDADAALLGFLGVITVYVLTTYNNSIRLTEEQIYRVRLEHKTEVERESGIGYSNYPGFDPLKAAEKEYELFKERIKQFEDHIKKLQANSKSACIWCAGSVLFFVVSILLSLLGMSQLPLEIKFYSVYLSAGFCLVGVITIFRQVFLLTEA